MNQSEIEKWTVWTRFLNHGWCQHIKVRNNKWCDCSSGFIHPIIYFDVDLNPTRMWCLCRMPAWTGKYMYDPVRLRLSLWVLVWCWPAWGTETGSRTAIRRIWHLQEELPAIGGFLCVCGTHQLIFPSALYLAATSLTVLHCLIHCCLHVPAASVTQTHFQIKGSVHMRHRELVYTVFMESWYFSNW